MSFTFLVISAQIVAVSAEWLTRCMNLDALHFGLQQYINSLRPLVLAYTAIAALLSYLPGRFSRGGVPIAMWRWSSTSETPKPRAERTVREG